METADIKPQDFDLETEDILTMSRPSIEDTMEIKEGGRLLRTILRDNFRPSLNQIDSYNYFISKDLINQIEKKSIFYGEDRNVMLRFGPTFVLPPTYVCRDRTLPLTPNLAILLGYDYMAEVKTFFSLVEGGDPNDPCKGHVYEQSSAPVTIGKIPCMLKSNVCHLHNKTPEQIAEMGSDYREPGGYFIVGNERLLFFTEKVRINRIIAGLTPKKGYHYANITATNESTDGTMVTTVTSIPEKQDGITKNIISLTLNSIRKAGPNKPAVVYNVLKILRLYAIYKSDLLGAGAQNYQNPYYLEKIIMQFIQEDRRSKCKTALAETIYNSFVNINNDKDNFERMVRENRDRYIKEQTKKKGRSAKIDEKPLSEAYMYALTSSLLSHEDHNNPVKVIFTACMLIAHLLEVVCGYRPHTNRNRWMYKRLDTAAVMISQLFRSFFKKYLTTLSTVTGGKSGRPSISALASKIPSKDMTKNFHTSFVTSWGLSTIKDADENPTQIIQQETFYEKLSLIAHSTPKVDRKVKNYDVRSQHPDQWGIIDPGDTSENAGVGLNRKIAITCYVTIPEDSDNITQVIHGNMLVSGYPQQNNTVDIPNEKQNTIVMVNGSLEGWADGSYLTRLLIKAKRTGVIPRKTSIFHDKHNRDLIISTDPGRATRPLLIVENNKPVIDTIPNGWDMNLDQLLQKEAIEFIDSAEVNKIRIATKKMFLEKWQDDRDHYMSRVEELSMVLHNSKDVDEIRDTKALLESAKRELDVIVNSPYTHLEIDPQALLGPTLTNMPFPQHNQAPRITYFSQQGKQALGTYHTEYAQRFDNDAKLLRRPVKPIAGHQLEEEMMLSEYQHGVMGNIAFVNLDGQTIEDAIIMSERVAESGMTSLGHYFVITVKLTNNEKLVKPKPRYGETEDNYKYLTKDGLPMINAPLSTGDFVLGKVYVDPKTGEQRNTSIDMKIGDSGFVDTVFVSVVSGSTIVKIRIRRHRETQIADKFASRYAQKATISEKYPYHKLPMDAVTGERPSFIVNTHSMPSRMTGGYMYEPVLSLAAILIGKRINAAPFQEVNVDEAYRILSSYGFDATGYRWFRNPDTGLRYKAMVYTGPIFMQILRHLGPEKLQVRATGLVKLLTQQPVRKSRVGGRRLGEMEKNALLGHGATNFLIERMVTMADKYKAPYCRRCGTIAIIHGESGQAHCRYCRSKKIETEIVRVKIPYVFKLLTQLMDACNIRIRFLFDEVEEIGKKMTPPPIMDQGMEIDGGMFEMSDDKDEDDDDTPDDAIFQGGEMVDFEGAFDIEDDDD